MDSVDEFVRVLLIEKNLGSAPSVKVAFDDPDSPWARIEQATSLAQALQILDKQKFDVILLDFGIVTPEGNPAFTPIREKAPKTPVLILTDEHDTRLSIRMMQQGAQDFLPKKEIQPLSLKRAVRNAMERQRINTDWEAAQKELLDRLEELAFIDDLTGLYNRRHLRRALISEMMRADRYAIPLSLVMIDLDKFKWVNDTYGHPAGDKVIAQLGHVIRSTTRDTDIAARYGGDEFCVVLTETDVIGAEVFAERLRKKIAAEKFSMSEGVELSCTSSLGVAGYSRAIFDTVGFIKRADKAMLDAKQSGGNAVRIFSPADEIPTV
ncbi:diguanylate cyclase [Candidatus Sumerlaeota bacterium]|nr:diguanylate cyclase [Candidatus Sumerlaeota bacterium]